MGKVAPLKKNQRSPRKKVDTAIVLAVIGLCGTVLTALLASPALVAWINQNSNSPAIPLTETPALQTPIMTETITTTATLPPSPSLTSIPLGQDWRSVLRLSIGSPCVDRLLPPNINPNENISIAEQQLAQAKDNKEYLDWLVAPALKEDRDGFVTLRVSSIVTGTEWVGISNELLVNVTTQEEMPDHVNVYGDAQCGGSGEIRHFPLFNLSNDFNVYEQKSNTQKQIFLLYSQESLKNFIYLSDAQLLGSISSK